MPFVTFSIYFISWPSCSVRVGRAVLCDPGAVWEGLGVRQAYWTVSGTPTGTLGNPGQLEGREEDRTRPSPRLLSASLNLENNYCNLLFVKVPPWTPFFSLLRKGDTSTYLPVSSNLKIDILIAFCLNYSSCHAGILGYFAIYI